MAVHTSLTYIRLKLSVGLLRFLTRLALGAARSSPNKVIQIPSRDSGRSIKINYYASPKSTDSPRPVLLNLHGSGFILPVHGSDDEFCARVARETDYIVLDMQYRLAPEHPWPSALHDVEDAVNYVLQRPEEFDLARFAISGFSAGGNLALATSGVVFDRKTFRSLLAFYPSTNKAMDPADRKTPDASGNVIPVFMSRLFDECYLPASVDRKDPLVSPSFAPTDNFPENALFVTAACDNLCLEAEELAARIENDGSKRNVVRRRMEGCGHGWDKNAKSGTIQEKAKDEAYALAIDMLRL